MAIFQTVLLSANKTFSVSNTWNNLTVGKQMCLFKNNITNKLFIYKS